MEGLTGPREDFGLFSGGLRHNEGLSRRRLRAGLGHNRTLRLLGEQMGQWGGGESGEEATPGLRPAMATVVVNVKRWGPILDKF